MRRHRILQNEYAYHVTTQTNGRTFRLNAETDHIFETVLTEACKRYGAVIHHYQLMSTHYHFLLSTPQSNLSAIMHYVNGTLAKRINRLQGTTGHLWGQRFHATIVDTTDYSNTCVPYVYQNPVRGGICARPSESRLLSSFRQFAYGTPTNIPVTADPFIFSLGNTDTERRHAFRTLIDVPLSPAQLQDIRKRLRKPFFGSPHFITRMQQQYPDPRHQEK